MSKTETKWSLPDGLVRREIPSWQEAGLDLGLVLESFYLRDLCEVPSTRNSLGDSCEVVAGKSSLRFRRRPA